MFYLKSYLQIPDINTKHFKMKLFMLRQYNSYKNPTVYFASAEISRVMITDTQKLDLCTQQYRVNGSNYYRISRSYSFSLLLSRWQLSRVVSPGADCAVLLPYLKV